uniref:Peroxisomal membrane protein 2 isoform X2 n=1 Tax=Rhizophora mucronata TaxID=61149 RepID=A0A2P2KAQ6_RHIMU
MNIFVWKFPPSDPMATLNAISIHEVCALAKPIKKRPHDPHSSALLLSPRSSPVLKPNQRRRRRRSWFVGSLTEEREAVDDNDIDNPSKNKAKDPSFLDGSKFFEALSSSSIEKEGESDGDKQRLITRSMNAAIVLGFGTLAVTRLLTIDRDYWHGWTLYEVLRYAPKHNWIAYEEALKTNPVLAKMAISGIVYSIGDWIAQCFEGKPLFEFEWTRMFRSGLVGFTLHGSLSHYYYQICEALFPFQNWWVVPAKVAFDQTVWSAIWNSIYYVVLGFLRLESPAIVFTELRTTFWPLLTVRCCSIFYGILSFFFPLLFAQYRGRFLSLSFLIYIQYLACCYLASFPSRESVQLMSF